MEKGIYESVICDYPSFKPDCPRSHESSEHDVCEKSVADDCDLTWMGYFGWGLAEEVVDYFFVAARFLEVSRGCIERWGGREWRVTFVECRRTATPSVFSRSFA